MPNFSKTYLYVTPTTLYHEFCNAFAFFTMVKACNPKMNRQNLIDAANNEWRKCRNEPETTIRNQISQYFVASSPNYRANSLSSHLSSHLSNEESNLAPNISAQRQALNLIKKAKAKANEYEENVSPSYFSTQEVIESLDNLDNDNYQLQLSNSNFMEDFSNLPSACPIQSNEVLDLHEALSDIE
ncbi:12394_t:CDS:2, partial [Gigaspora rosea]